MKTTEPLMSPGDRVRIVDLSPDPFDVNGRTGVVVGCHPMAAQVRVDVGDGGIVDVPAECVRSERVAPDA